MVKLICWFSSQNEQNRALFLLKYNYIFAQEIQQRNFVQDVWILNNKFSSGGNFDRLACTIHLKAYNCS